MATHGEIRWPSLGSFDGRLRGDSHGRRQQLQPNPTQGFGYTVAAESRNARQPPLTRRLHDKDTEAAAIPRSAPTEYPRCRASSVGRPHRRRQAPCRSGTNSDTSVTVSVSTATIGMHVSRPGWVLALLFAKSRSLDLSARRGPRDLVSRKSRRLGRCQRRWETAGAAQEESSQPPLPDDSFAAVSVT